MVKKEGFRGVCYRCGEEINIYHRYCYTCIDSACDVSFHKFCAELPTRLENTLHQHPLILHQMQFDWQCGICKSRHKRLEICYYCFECHFGVDINCTVEVGKKIIYHPCHPHLLMCAISQPILCNCMACGKEHKGVFYQCTICNSYTIHSECAFLPKTLLIQQTTDDAFYHTHPLTISYSFPLIDQRAKFNPKCRVCGDYFYNAQNLWIYKCDKCMYYAHVDCATSRREPFMSIFLSAGLGKLHKNFKDVDHPHLLHLPFPDETYSIPKHLFFQESRRGGEVNLKHTSHQHPLILVDETRYNGQTSSPINYSLLMCHDPMKKIQLVCNGCLRPIMSSMPFYKCSENCNFVLHEWCTRLPQEIENYPGHQQHTLVLMYSNALPMFIGVFYCGMCCLPCNGFAYGCVECKYYVDVTCAFIPREITHKSHPNHLFSLVQKQPPTDFCHICKYQIFRWDSLSEHQLSYHCDMCAIDLHTNCALLLATTIRHKYDKHPMHLSYLPIENHKSEYFCEMCEEVLNPHRSFYHCRDCAQSIHACCAPQIPPCDTNVAYQRRSIYYYVNVKFGSVHNIDGHPHPLLFAQGIMSDVCNMCHTCLNGEIIFKCLRCTFALHYRCLGTKVLKRV